ncbi:MAG TPA: carboxypeptidase regulatory-like domain-containing protein, partial [Thermoanaerobaculia bacterium]|nr:carboxypeptidase regulatory-like domain-containing protein [Thermoanaerobaculia bacterium]
MRFQLALVLLLATRALAQTTASLEGVVHANDHPLPGVTVTVTSPALQGSRVTITGDGGRYSFAALPPGPYLIRFSFANATPISKKAELQLSQTTRVDATLYLTAIIDTITVAGDIPSPVHTQEIATTLTGADVERLPHQRNQLAVAQLMPGVNANTLSNGQLQIAGGPGYDNLVLVNGVVVTENRRSQMRPMYVEDAIVETSVLTGAVSAEYGRFTGGVVNTITKSGGEAWSGSLRDSLSNPSWSATSPANEAREDHLNHVLEATLGGSLVAERLWFFTSARWARNDTARQTIAVPGNPPSPQLSYSESNDQQRYEAKLTGRVHDAHTVAASWFGIATKTKNSRFANNIYDAASLTSRDEPESLLALRYDGQLAQTVFVEAQLSRRTMSLSSGAFTRELIGGTVLLDRANGNARFGAPSLCAICEDERRDNDDVLAKAHWFVDGTRGTHDIVIGADRFRERHFLEDHQSGSGFAVFVTRAQYANGTIQP